ncbi:MAG: right-handed parallel beta-helix repeat-containing protein, partial [Syntrophomonas sp.]|nr:right-handed parallel beta-helix repeat-containing protein [Syntrophomonas sp.]
GDRYYFYNLCKIGTGMLSVTNSTISNGGDYGILIANSSEVHTVSNNTISSNGYYGINCYNSSPVIQGNDIYSNNVGLYCASEANPVIGGSVANRNSIHNNSAYGVQNVNTSLRINAQYNWWGDASGPYHTTTNSSGLGNKVGDYVDYSNYCTSP